MPSSGGGKKLIRTLRTGAAVAAGENIGVGVGGMIGVSEGAAEGVSSAGADGSCPSSVIALA